MTDLTCRKVHGVAPGTCRQCGGTMRPGKSLAQTWGEVSPDFPGENTIGTINYGGPGAMIDCMKCEKCGWSVT